MPKFTRIPTDTFENLQINAGMLATGFDVATEEIPENGQLAATTGGISFNSNPQWGNIAEGVDNIKTSPKEFMRITSYDPTLSGTFIAINPELCKKLCGAAKMTAPATGGKGKAYKITPSYDIAVSDFFDLWFIGDYSSDNSEASGGFIAIHLLNALNTTGFQLQTEDKGKGQFSFEFHGHESISNPDTVPFEIYIKPKGGASGVAEAVKAEGAEE